jgi:bacterioferritin-associated ferredoxin
VQLSLLKSKLSRLIVCVCLGISEDQIKEAASKDMLAALYQMGMCQACGSCREEVKNILENLIQDDEDEYYR